MNNEKLKKETIALLKEHYNLVKKICDKGLEALEVIEKVKSENLEELTKKIKFETNAIELYTIALSTTEEII